MNDGNVSRQKSSHVFFAAFFACALAARCGDISEAVPGLDGCVHPAQDYGLCYETLGQKPSPLEKMMGSPGVSVRIFGRAQGRPVALITSNGGAEIPDAWREQYGRPDCYARNIDFPDVRRQLAERPISADLAVHKRRVLAMVAAVERDYLENPMFAGTSCEGVTADNMVTLVEQQHTLARQQSETIARVWTSSPNHSPAHSLGWEFTQELGRMS